MLKNVRKSKILLSLIVVALMIVLFGNIYSLATESNNGTVTITAITPANNTTNTENTNTSTNTNTNTNNASNSSNVITTNVSASTNNTNTNNTNTNTNTNNASTYNSVSNKTGLPYTGTDSKVILLVVVFAISAVYAYKKINDYNV